MNIDLSLDVKEVEAIVNSLRKMPMELVEELVMKLKIQTIPQVQAQSNPVPPADPTVPADPSTPSA